MATSGGADSLCLADAILSTTSQHRHTPLVAHLDHGLRGEASRGDAAFVQAFAQAHGVPCVIEHADVQAHAKAHTVSIEVAARDLRYAFLARVAHQHTAALVATAHHADDQAETVLMRLLRGTGISGLRGMQVRSPMPNAPEITLLRPLLRITRKEIEQYCTECGLHPRHDASNDDPHHTRNRIRHELLPLLEKYNPNIAATLARLADTLTHDVDIIEYATHEAFDHVARVNASAVTVDRVAWRNLPAGLQRAILREAVSQLKGDITNLSYAAIEEARAVLISDAGVGEIALMRDVRIDVAWQTFVLVHLRSL